ncbi:hypothetical protein GCM10017559_55950 [Streptosporangium longisporum]|uniref:Uncharacterized protein n=1 Tax=Streptosporangium longisporum TaxID=46187 RepID=A0ABN3Y9G5_9ACTN
MPLQGVGPAAEQVRAAGATGVLEGLEGREGLACDVVDDGGTGLVGDRAVAGAGARIDAEDGVHVFSSRCAGLVIPGWGRRGR